MLKKKQPLLAIFENFFKKFSALRASIFFLAQPAGPNIISADPPSWVGSLTAGWKTGAGWLDPSPEGRVLLA